MNVLKNRVISIMSVAFLMLISSPVFSASCGQGKIIDLKEGGWNVNAVAIQLSGPNSTIGDATKQRGPSGSLYIWYKESVIGTERLNAIRKLAALAFAMDATVLTYTHPGGASNGNCWSATEMSLLR